MSARSLSGKRLSDLNIAHITVGSYGKLLMAVLPIRMKSRILESQS